MRISVLLALVALVLLAPTMVGAKEDVNHSVSVEGTALGVEYNALPSGNSVVFSTESKTDDVSMPKKKVGPDDIHESHLRSNYEVRVDFLGWAELWAHLHTESDEGLTLRSGGGEFSLLTPLDWLGWDRWRVGYYHLSNHNFSDYRYGKGVSLNGIHVQFDQERTDDSPLEWRVWYTHMFSSDYSPYVFTPDAETMRRSNLATTKSRLGFRASYFGDDLAWQWQTVLVDARPGIWGNEVGGPASLENRLDITIYQIGALKIGPFFKYDFNLRKQDQFGDSVTQAGIVFAIEDGKPR